MECTLCKSINSEEEFGFISSNVNAFSVICKWSIKAGHCLVLPKRHVEDISELSPEESKDLFSLLSSLRKKIEKTYNEDPLVILNFGKHSTQKHIHIHIFPSKGSLRDLISSYEHVPRRENLSKEKTKEMRNLLANEFE